jgi:hypothetical protein
MTVSPTTIIYCQQKISEWTWGNGGMILTGENRNTVLWEKLSQWHFVHHKSHMDCNEIAVFYKNIFLSAADQVMAKFSLFTSQCHRNLVMLCKTKYFFSPKNSTVCYNFLQVS